MICQYCSGKNNIGSAVDVPEKKPTSLHSRAQSFIPFYSYCDICKTFKIHCSSGGLSLSSEREKNPKRHCQQAQGQKEGVWKHHHQMTKSSLGTVTFLCERMNSVMLKGSASKDTIKLQLITTWCYCGKPFLLLEKLRSYFHHWHSVRVYSFRPWSWAYTQNIYLARD